MKLLEWVIEKHLWKHLEDASFLSIAVSKYHWGFRKAKLTNDQLFHLSQTVLESFNRGKQVITSFLGVEKAFDNVWHNRLRYETLQLGLGKTHKLILLWETFFECLCVCVCVCVCVGGGVTQEHFSNFSNYRFFQAEKLPEKPFQQWRIL